MRTFIPLLFLFLCAACSPRLSSIPTDIVPNPTVGIDDERFRMELTHVATTPDFVFFELWMVNQSEQYISVAPADFHIRTFDNYVKTPVSTDVLMQALHIEKRQIKKRRKRQTIWAGLGVVGAVAGVFWGGGNTFDVIADPVYASADLYDVRRFGRMNIESVEEEMDYIQEVNLDTLVNIAPKDTLLREIAFDLKFIPEELKISYKNELDLNFRGKDLAPRLP